MVMYNVGNGRSENVQLDIMFLAIRVSCSLAVRTMRASAQRGSGGGLASWAGGLGKPSAPSGKQGWFGAAPPNSIPRQSQNQNFAQVYFAAGCMTNIEW